MTYDLSNYMYNGLHVPMEFWKPITQEMVPNIKPIYWISSLGNVYNSETCRYSSITVREGKYVQVTLRTVDNRQISMNIHRLVCMAFHGMPIDDTYEVDHINCEKSCNYEENLEWVTPKENINRACINNLIKTGEDNYRSILTNDEVVMICEMLMQHIPIKDICSIMESKIYPRVYPSGFKGLISHIIMKDVWRDVVSKYDFPDYTRSNFSNDEIEIICQSLETGMRYDDILRKLGYTDCSKREKRQLKETIYNIKAGNSYKEISSKYNIENNKSYVLTNEEIDFICKNIAYGVSPVDILNQMGDRGKEKSVRSAVYDINRGICHKKEVSYYKNLA